MEPDATKHLSAMTNERWIAVNNGADKLTPEEIAQGWHYCWDWDGLLVGPDMKEMECCTCVPKQNKS